MTTTTTGLNALTMAEALMAVMPGWTLSPTTLTNVRERDAITRTWADLVNANYPGAELSINTTRDEGRVSIQARYPRDWQPWIDGARRFAESITVSAAKSPNQIATEINRRIFRDTGYLARVVECMARKAESEQGYDAAEALARELAATVGAKTEYDRVAKNDSVSHLKTNENRKRFKYHTGSPNYTTKVEGEVGHGGKAVQLTLSNLTPEQARTVLAAWKAAQQS